MHIALSVLFSEGYGFSWPYVSGREVQSRVTPRFPNIIPQKRITRAQRLAELCGYALIGLLVVAVAMVFAIHEARIGGNGELPWRWVWTVASAAFLFGYALLGYWRFRRHLRFWVAFFGMLTAHSAACWYVIGSVEHFSLVVAGLLMIGESAVIWMVLGWVVDGLKAP